MAEHIELEVEHCFVVEDGAFSIFAAGAAPIDEVSEAIQEEGLERASDRSQQPEAAAQWPHGAAEALPADRRRQR